MQNNQTKTLELTPLELRVLAGALAREVVVLSAMPQENVTEWLETAETLLRRVHPEVNHEPER